MKNYIMKSLRMYLKERLILENDIKYHLSYDAIDCKRDFNDNYDNAKHYLLCVMKNTPFVKMTSFNSCSIILEYSTDEYDKLIEYLKHNLSSYFFYSFSKVAKNDLGNYCISNNPNKELNDKFEDNLNNLVCENFKNITSYS